MIVEHKFTINGTRVYPTYSNDLNKDCFPESGLKFLRQSLSGKIKLIGADFTWLFAQPFNTKFYLEIEQWDNNAWVPYFSGVFTKTDCAWDIDDQAVEIKAATNDNYDAILNILDKEVNLIELLPKIEKIDYFNRPILQLYAIGNNSISNVINGSVWEQDVPEAISVAATLINTYKFKKCNSIMDVSVTNTGSATPITVEGGYAGTEIIYPALSGGIIKYNFKFYLSSGDCAIHDVLTDTKLFEYTSGFINDPPYQVVLNATGNLGSTGSVTAWIMYYDVYARLLTNVSTFNSVPTVLVPTIDIVEPNKNYKMCLGIDIATVQAESTYSSTPTIYGLNDFNQYFSKPSYNAHYYKPVLRNKWSNISLWHDTSMLGINFDTLARSVETLRDAYPLYSVISVILNKLAPGITFDKTSEYSEFFYSGLNPITFQRFSVFLTQKTNMMVENYDGAAKKATITLGDVFGMLKSVYKCLWHLDGTKLRIENILWYNSGGSYTVAQEIGVDLTTEIDRHINKVLGFGQNKYSYEKANMPEHYQFKWMDITSESFEGYPIEVLSDYVSKGMIENVNVSKFTPDVDYIVANYKSISQDGFALLAAVQTTTNIIFNAGYGLLLGHKINTAGVIVVDAGFNVSNTIQVQVGQQYVFSHLCAIRIINGIDVLIYHVTEVDAVYLLTIPNGGWQMQISCSLATWSVLTISYTDLTSKYTLPMIQRIVDGLAIYMQNGYLSWINIHPSYYIDDMPAYSLKINDVLTSANSIQRNKIQVVEFPAGNIDVNKLIKTSLGNGVIDKISLNLSSRIAKATLRYETE